MEVRVLVVDDSVFYRHRLVAALSAEQDIVVVGEACNGMEGVEKARSLHPDVIIMDVNMPVMDGVTAVRHIMEERPTKILMFSSLTTKGAQATFDALDAGAVDFITKHIEELNGDPKDSLRHLCRRVRILGSAARVGGRIEAADVQHAPVSGAAVMPQRTYSHSHDAAESAVCSKDIRLIVIGTSTGGPVALQSVLTMLPQGYPIPIVVVQHMPPSFTKAFAERLDRMCMCSVREVQDSELMMPATIYIAPGGFQTVVKRRSDGVYVQVREPSPGEIYRPSVDITFISAADALSNGVLGVVLTGMGADGKDGAGVLKARGSRIWVQDEQSSTIFGMPKAVISAGYADEVMSLKAMGKALSGLA